MVECDVSDELELLVKLARPILLESRLLDDELPSSFSESALRSLFLNMDEPFPLALLDDDVCGDVLLLVMTEEAFDSVDWCPLPALAATVVALLAEPAAAVTGCVIALSPTAEAV
jgi:hypothetical protein